MRQIKYMTRKTLKVCKLRFYINKYKLRRKIYIEVGIVLKNWNVKFTIKNDW